MRLLILAVILLLLHSLRIREINNYLIVVIVTNADLLHVHLMLYLGMLIKLI